jgi:hypothetical protein
MLSKAPLRIPFDRLLISHEGAYLSECADHRLHERHCNAVLDPTLARHIHRLFLPTQPVPDSPFGI